MRSSQQPQDFPHTSTYTVNVSKDPALPSNAYFQFEWPETMSCHLKKNVTITFTLKHSIHAIVIPLPGEAACPRIHPESLRILTWSLKEAAPHRGGVRGSGFSGFESSLWHSLSYGTMDKLPKVSMTPFPNKMQTVIMPHRIFVKI